jgi:hypothetical protein
MDLLIMKFLHCLVTSSLLVPKILLNTLFSSTLSLRSSLNVSDQVSHPNWIIHYRWKVNHSKISMYRHVSGIRNSTISIRAKKYSDRNKCRG